MKRLLSMLLSCMLLLCPLALAEQEATLVGVWVETEGYGTLTLRLDGSATMVYYDGSMMDTTWSLTDDGYRFGDGMWYNSPMKLLDENTLSVSDGWMVFAREGFLPTTDEALLLGAEPVGEEGEPYLGEWALTSIIIEDEEVAPELFGMSLSLIFNADGTVVTQEGEEAYTTTWYVSYGFAVVEGDVLYIDDDDLLIFDQEDGSMIFTRVLTAETDPANPADPIPVGEAGAAYFGPWTLESMLVDGMSFDPSLFGMTMTMTFFEDGTVTSDDGMDTETTLWYVADGAAIVEGSAFTLNEEGKLIMTDEEGSMLVFTQGEAEPAGELSEEEQLIALLEMLAMMGGMEEDLSDLPENHQGFVGDWHLCYVMTGGLSGDLRALGITGMLSLNADYTGELTGLADESGSWYEDEAAVIRFGENGMPMFLIDATEDNMGIFLQYGTEDSGCMIFHQEEEAVWTPGLYPLQTPASANAAGTAPAAGGALLTDVKYICTSYTTSGITLDATTLGAEYAVIFGANGTASFTLAGFTLPALSYTITDGLYVLDYYGTPFSCTPTETGFDMDYYGTMLMHFVPVE